MAKQKSKLKVPAVPNWSWRVLGPGIVLIAMGLGSGEFILWPYFISKYGFGLLWGAVIGITLQYFVSNETGRYTLLSGDSVFVGMRKLSRWLPLWFIISTFLSFGWPGIIGSSGQVLGFILNTSEHKWFTIAMLISIALILTSGGKIYSRLEKVQTITTAILVPIIVVIAIAVFRPEIINDIAAGLIGQGKGYNFIPEGVNLIGLLGAIAYSGAAGNLLLSHSFYIQDKGMAMAKHAHSQIDVTADEALTIKNLHPEMTATNIARLKQWFSIVAREQFITFWGIGLLTIILIMVIAYMLIYPYNGPEGLAFVQLQAEKLSLLVHPLLGLIFMGTGVVLLYQTQLGVFESTSRIMSENLLLTGGPFTSLGRAKTFNLFVWAQTLFAIAISFLNLATPLEVLFLNSFFSALSMLVLSITVQWLNNSAHMPSGFRPNRFRNLMLTVSTIFFAGFTILVGIDQLT